MYLPTTALWYAMRISYSSAPRLMRIKGILDKDARVFRTYVAMKYQKVKDKMTFAPAVNNLIFVYTTYENMRLIKKDSLYSSLRYIMHRVSDDNDTVHSEPIYVQEKLMNDFIRVTEEANEKVVYLDNLSFACKPGQKVQITDGQFAGVKGVIKRIQGNICVVLPIKNTIAAAITGVPRSHLRYITDEEFEKEIV